MVPVIPRSEWGARYADGGGSAPVPYTEFWLHHSVTIAPDLVPPFDDEYRAMRTLEDIGQQRFGQGISYTWPIMPNGRVYQGHSVNRLGAHTGGRNSAARAICLVGNYDVAEVTPAQIESAAQLMVQEYRAGRAKRYTLNGGHQQLKATTCPGRNGMAAIPLINARAVALIGGAAPIEEDDVSAADVFNTPIHYVLPDGTPAHMSFGEFCQALVHRTQAVNRGGEMVPMLQEIADAKTNTLQIAAKLEGLLEVVQTLAAARGGDIDVPALLARIDERIAAGFAEGVDVRVIVGDSPGA